MKKRMMLLTFAIGMSATALMPYSMESVSAVIRYQDNYSASADELFIPASDIIEFVREDRTYIVFADATGMGEILVISKRPESNAELAKLIKAEKRNIRYCCIEDENCIVYYDYNTGEIIETDFSTEIKYTFDFVDGKVISKATGEEICEITYDWHYTVYDGRYIKSFIYTSVGTLISPTSLTKLPATDPSAFTCSSRDIVKIIRDDEEVLCFADQTGLGIILILSEKPATDEELISAMKEPKKNIHFCYLEKENKILYYDYNENALSETEDKMEIKYTIDLTQRNMVNNSNNEVVLDFNESSAYWVVNEKNEKKEMILAGPNFISPAGYVPVETDEIKTGDINGDGIVDLTDLLSLSLYLLGDSELTDEQLKVADADKNGKVNIADLARVQQYVAKVIEKF